MKMTPAGIISGCVIIFAAVFIMTVFLPHYRETFERSDIFRTRTPLEEQGREIFIQNGCSYCHSQYVRAVDWDLGAERIAQAGD